jgi:hypothetical protein
MEERTIILFIIFYIIQLATVLAFLYLNEYKSKKQFLWWCIPFIPIVIFVYKSFTSKFKELD